MPVLGERGDIADNELPTQALRLSQNVFRSERGLLTARPGYKALNTTHPGGRIMGIGYFRTAAGAERELAANKTQVWQYNGTNWVNITDSALSGDNFNHVRFVTFPTAGIYSTIIMNSVNTPKTWDGSAGTYSDLGGTPGVSIDGVVCANRLVLLQAPNRIKVSDFNNPAVWPIGAGFNIDLIDQGDLMVGIGSLNRTAGAALGEESQWVFRAQTGNNPLRVEKISTKPGPMSAAVVISLGGVIYYLGDDYNVYRFDGATPATEVGWAMKNWVNSTINIGSKKMAHGAYFDKIGKIFWFFPAGSDQAPNYGIHFDPKTGEMGRLVYGNRYITSSGRVRVVVTITWDDLTPFTWDNLAATYPTWDSFGDPAAERRTALGSADGGVYIAGVGDGSDDGTPIEALWEVPLKSYGGWPKAITPSTFETFFEKTPSPTTAELSIGHTDTLMGDLDYTLIEAFDLFKEQRNDIDVTAVQEKRFVTIRQKVTAKNGMNWQGGLFQFEPTDVVKGPTSDA